jgi:hypothetical protein
MIARPKPWSLPSELPSEGSSRDQSRSPVGLSAGAGKFCLISTDIFVVLMAVIVATVSQLPSLPVS